MHISSFLNIDVYDCCVYEQRFCLTVVLVGNGL